MTKVKLIVLDPAGVYIPGKGGRPQGGYFEMDGVLAQAYVDSDPARFKIETLTPVKSGSASSKVTKEEAK